MSAAGRELRACAPLVAALSVWAAAAWLGPELVDPADLAMDMTRVRAAPSGAHPLGCDNLGRDVLARVSDGARTAFLVAAPAAAASVALGGALGIFAGMGRGGRATFVGWAGGVSLAFPRIVLALALGALLGGGTVAVLLAFVLAAWPAVAEPTRAQVEALRREQFVRAAVAMGAPPGHILRRHLLPGVRGVWLARLGGLAAQATLAEGALGFLGLGVREPQTSWGAMLRDGLPMIGVHSAPAAAAGCAMFAVVLAVNLTADAAARRLDPRRSA